MFPSVCSFIVCWFSLSFTTCFGLHGHLQVCRILCLRILLLCFFGSLSFFHVVTLCFPFVFCSCAVFLCVFIYLFILCFLLAHYCGCLSILCCYLLSPGGNITCNTNGTIQCSRMLKYKKKNIVLFNNFV
jgi:hypothetical protein